MAPSNDLRLLQSRLADCLASIDRCTEQTAHLGKEEDDQSSSLPDGMSAMLKDLLLTFRHDTTSLALAFKPPLTIPAAIKMLDKFIIDICQIASAVHVASMHTPSGVLLDAWKDGALNIYVQAGPFLRALFDSTRSNGSTSQVSNDDNPYLHYTAMIWERVDAFHASISASEGEAVAKRWKLDTNLVKDAWTEFKESIEGMEVTSSIEDGKGDVAKEVEGLDEDDMEGFGSSTISKEEQKTVESIKALLQLLQLLHAFLPRLIPSLDFSEKSRGRAFIRTSLNFSSAFDDLVCALYPPHSSRAIDQALGDVDEVVGEMLGLVRKCRPSPEGEAFVAKWEERMKVERAKWEERRLSLGGLMDSLA